MVKTEVSIEQLWDQHFETRNDKVKQQLVDFYFNYVQKIAGKLAAKMRWKVHPTELASFGVDGLYNAIDGYDPDRNVKFEIYARPRIKGAMIDGLRREDIVPRTVRMNISVFERTKQHMQTESGEFVSDIEVLRKMGIEDKNLNHSLKKFSSVYVASLDHSNNHSQEAGSEGMGEGHSDYNDMLKDTHTEMPGNGLMRREFFSKLMGKSFSRVEQKIVYYYYYESLTMGQVADKVNLSESRVSQMHKDILSRLRNKIERNPDYFGTDVMRIFEDQTGAEQPY